MKTTEELEIVTKQPPTLPVAEIQDTSTNAYFIAENIERIFKLIIELIRMGLWVQDKFNIFSNVVSSTTDLNTLKNFKEQYERLHASFCIQIDILMGVDNKDHFKKIIYLQAIIASQQNILEMEFLLQENRVILNNNIIMHNSIILSRYCQILNIYDELLNAKDPFCQFFEKEQRIIYDICFSKIKQSEKASKRLPPEFNQSKDGIQKLKIQFQERKLKLQEKQKQSKYQEAYELHMNNFKKVSHEIYIILYSDLSACQTTNSLILHWHSQKTIVIKLCSDFKDSLATFNKELTNDQQSSPERTISITFIEILEGFKRSYALLGKFIQEKIKTLSYLLDKIAVLVPVLQKIEIFSSEIGDRSRQAKQLTTEEALLQFDHRFNMAFDYVFMGLNPCDLLIALINVSLDAEASSYCEAYLKKHQTLIIRLKEKLDDNHYVKKLLILQQIDRLGDLMVEFALKHQNIFPSFSYMMCLEAIERKFEMIDLIQRYYVITEPLNTTLKNMQITLLLSIKSALAALTPMMRSCDPTFKTCIGQLLLRQNQTSNKIMIVAPSLPSVKLELILKEYSDTNYFTAMQMAEIYNLLFNYHDSTSIAYNPNDLLSPLYPQLLKAIEVTLYRYKSHIGNLKNKMKAIEQADNVSSLFLKETLKMTYDFTEYTENLIKTFHGKLVRSLEQDEKEKSEATSVVKKKLHFHSMRASLLEIGENLLAPDFEKKPETFIAHAKSIYDILHDLSAISLDGKTQRFIFILRLAVIALEKMLLKFSNYALTEPNISYPLFLKISEIYTKYKNRGIFRYSTSIKRADDLFIIIDSIDNRRKTMTIKQQQQQDAAAAALQAQHQQDNLSTRPADVQGDQKTKNELHALDTIDPEEVSESTTSDTTFDTTSRLGSDADSTDEKSLAEMRISGSNTSPLLDPVLEDSAKPLDDPSPLVCPAPLSGSAPAIAAQQNSTSAVNKPLLTAFSISEKMQATAPKCSKKDLNRRSFRLKKLQNFAKSLPTRTTQPKHSKPIATEHQASATTPSSASSTMLRFSPKPDAAYVFTEPEILLHKHDSKANTLMIRLAGESGDAFWVTWQEIRTQLLHALNHSTKLVNTIIFNSLSNKYTQHIQKGIDQKTILLNQLYANKPLEYFYYPCAMIEYSPTYQLAWFTNNCQLQVLNPAYQIWQKNIEALNLAIQDMLKDISTQPEGVYQISKQPITLQDKAVTRPIIT